MEYMFLLSLRPILFELFKEKLQRGGGVKLAPPPNSTRVKDKRVYISNNWVKVYKDHVEIIRKKTGKQKVNK